MAPYKAVVVGCSRMGAFIDNEIPLQEVSLPLPTPPGPTSTPAGRPIPTHQAAATTAVG